MGAGASAADVGSIDEEKLRVLCREKFEELDVDKSGFLENEELMKVAEWVLSSFSTTTTSLEVINPAVISLRPPSS